MKMTPSGLLTPYRPFFIGDATLTNESQLTDHAGKRLDPGSYFKDL